MKKQLLELFRVNPIVAAVKDEMLLQKALNSNCTVVDILYGNICNIADLVERVHKAGKCAMVHAELVDGASTKEVVVDFLKNNAKADGIISTRAATLRAAKNRGLMTIHRFFLVDSIAFHSLPKQYAISQADVVEIMPGCITDAAFKWVKDLMKGLPIMASGLVCDLDDARAVLKRGAVAISSSSPEVWSVLNKKT